MGWDEALAARVRRRLAGRGDVRERKMMGALAFMVDGAMCCAVGPEGLLVRVSAEERDAALRDPRVRPMQLGARTMSGFVRVQPEALRTAASLARWLERSQRAAEAARPAKPRARAGRARR